MSGFAEPLRLNAIRSGDRLHFVATDEEREDIADRLGLVALDRFEAEVTLERNGDLVTATGRVTAKAAQPCIATGEPVHETVDEPVTLRFVPVPGDGDPDEEIELDANELDTVFHDGQVIDLGDALADTLSLALDPYPRSPNAEEVLRDAGVLSEEEAGPFSGLAALKEAMQKKGG